MAITIDGTNGLSSDNAALKLDGTTLVVDETNNRVGVGTASPAVAMDVVGQVRASTGILFGSDTAAANALDDYEEGTWTPVLNSFTNTGGRTLTGQYIKIGKLVHVIVSITAGTQTLTSTGNSSNISGLPFTVAASDFSCFAGISTNFIDTVNQGSQIYSGGNLIYTVSFTAASTRKVSIEGTYQIA